MNEKEPVKREMKAALAGTVAVMLLVFTFFYAAPLCSAEDTSVSYQLINQTDGVFSYTLNVVVPQSLSEYYNDLSHKCASDRDFPKFVTPYALKPMADCLREIYPDDEDFTNGVLMLVHQIPYEETVSAYYPVETMLRKSGDCDLLAFIAASILKAEGLDVVLLHYADEEHMNVGVHLADAPKDARLDIYSITNDGVEYYVAECTTSDWKEGWRVGECPSDLKNATAQIVTLENCEQVAPGQVSASFKKLDPTALTLQVSSVFTTEGSTITLRGQLSPALPNENVTFYLRVNGSPWTVLNTTVTQPDGQFEYNWKSETAGLCNIRASWTGNEQYAGTTSQTRNAIIVPFYVWAIIAASIIAIVLSVVAVWIHESNGKKNAETPTNPNTIQQWPPNHG